MADKQKAVPDEAVSRPLGDCFLRYKCHIETLKSSKIVVNYVKIVVLRGFRGQIEANSCSAMADE